MIIVKIMGGLGNQFFTYATAYAVAAQVNAEVILDEQIYHTFYSLRECQLKEFNILYRKNLMKFSLGRSKKLIRLYNKMHDLLLKYMYHAEIIEEEKQFSYQRFNLDSQENYYLKGYWQNWRYFHQYRKEIVEQFDLKNKSKNVIEIIDLIKTEKPIAVHVRRTDYKTFQGGKCLSLKYYKKGIEEYRKMGDDAPLWIFTDDIEFSKQNLGKGEKIFFPCKNSKLSDIEEFYIMSKCSKFIIANSTFSWWAAYLSNYNDKHVIAPVVDMWKSDFYLPEWFLIETELE